MPPAVWLDYCECYLAKHSPQPADCEGRTQGVQSGVWQVVRKDSNAGANVLEEKRTFVEFQTQTTDQVKVQNCRGNNKILAGLL